MHFYGFQRSNGSIGVRNIILVIAPVDCSYEPAKRIAYSMEEAVAITQPYGCNINQMIVNNFVGVAQNPNVACVLLVGEGCEALSVNLLSEKLSEIDKPIESVICQRDGGTVNTIKKGTKLLKKMSLQIEDKREPFDISNLTIGLECGGSDKTSTIANSATGITSDILVEEGGTVIVSEPQEMIGTKNLLLKRTKNKEVAKKLGRLISKYEKRMKGFPQKEILSYGNIEGGLTTIEEKSLGAILKMGSKPIQNVLENSNLILEKPSGKGLHIQDGANHDVPSITHMIAAGAQVIVFITGRGATTGHAIAPVIKVTANPITYSNMKDNIDIYVGTNVKEKDTIERMGEKIFEEVIRVASGHKTKSETLGYKDFIIHKEDRTTHLINQLITLPGGYLLYKIAKKILI